MSLTPSSAGAGFKGGVGGDEIAVGQAGGNCDMNKIHELIHSNFHERGGAK